MDEASDEKELIVDATRISPLVETVDLENAAKETEEHVPLRSLSSRQDDYSKDQVSTVGTERPVTSDRDQQVQDDMAMKISARRLRRFLRTYFYPAFKLQGTKCTINMLQCILFIVQILKLTLITMQMINFGEDRGHFGDIVNRGETTLRHLLLEGWDSSWEDLPYPPDHGDFAVYDIDELTRRINYAVERYYNVENVAIGFYVRIPENDTLSATIQCFDVSQCHNCTVGRHGSLNLSKLNFDVDKGLTSHTNSTTNVTKYTYDIMKEFAHHNLEQPIKRLLLLTMTFTLHSVRIFDEGNEALCLSVAGELTFSDLDNNGQVIIDLSTVSSKIKCSELKLEITDWSLQRASKNLATGVICVCVLGLMVTILIIIFAIFLFTQTKMFMHKYYGHYYKPESEDEKDLPFSEYFRFVLPWDLCATLADCLTLYGTIKISFKTERRQIDLNELDLFTIWLAVGCFFAWFNILRFVKFYDKFRLLFVTVYRATPNVLAFIVCVVVLYTGFFVVGYVVLGPYHIKFATPSKASETLTAMVNGDEIYATFGILQAEDYSMIWWFFRIYLWTYIAVFTIVILNLLVAIFMSAYDAVTDNTEEETDGEQEFGPVEKALIQYLDKPNKSQFRSSLSDLMASNHKFDSWEERALRTQLSKICRVSTTGDDVILVKPRTLKDFMAEDVDAKEFTFKFMTFSFISIFQND